MSKIEIKQIFIAHPVEFVSKSIKAFAKEGGIETYILDNLEDFSYLITDLDPEFILMKEDLYLANKASVDDQLNGHEKVQFVLIKKEATTNELAIIEPFDPSNIKDILKELLVSKSKDQ